LKISFQGNVGLWPNTEIGATLVGGATPYHCQRPMSIPHAHCSTLKKEIDCLVSIGVLEEVDGNTAGPWCSPSFIIPKKDGTVRFIADYREVNRRIVRKQWPMPHIADLLQDIGRHYYASALDLSMGSYHFKLDKKLQDMSTFVLPWGLYKYKRPPMPKGLSISPDLFQANMQMLLADLPFVKVCLDDVLIFSNGSYQDHMKKVEQVLERLRSKNLAVNARKSSWTVKEVDYLGFRLTRKGVKPQARKIAALMNVKAPKTKHQLRRFIGLVNYYRYMWKGRSHLMTPLTDRTSKTMAFKWMLECQHSFNELKKLISKEVLLSFPDYTQKFVLMPDASDRQPGAVLMQNGKPLAFFSKKLNKYQQKYTVGRRKC